MRLTKYSDIGLRFLTLAALNHPKVVGVTAAAQTLEVSQDHLQKVVRRLAEMGWLTSRRGRSVGYAISASGLEASVREVVSHLEPDFDLVACMREEGRNCPLSIGCRLPGLLAQATDAFLLVLERARMVDLIDDNGGLLFLRHAG